MGKRSVGLTLVELLVSIAIFSVILLALTTISAFSHRHIIDASRRAALQQEASFVVEHVTNSVKSAIGSPVFPGMLTSGVTQIAMRIDRNSNGIPDDDGANQWIAYYYRDTPFFLVDYFANYPSGGAPWPTAGGLTIASRITNFTVAPQNGTNHVFVQVTACFNPAGTGALACGKEKNPSVTISSNIDTPMISQQ